MKKSFISLLGTILSIGIILFLAYIMLKSYQKPSTQLEEATGDRSFSGGYTGVINKAKATVNMVNEKTKQQDDALSN